MEIMNDKERLTLMGNMMGMGTKAVLYDGWEAMVLDVENFKPVIPLEKIEAPTLIVHGINDGDIPFSMAE